MRFDLEIPSTAIDLVYLEEGAPLPRNMATLAYIDIDTSRVVISDLINIQQGQTHGEYGRDISEVKGPNFYAQGEKFLITHITKYIPTENVKVPLFYKHVVGSGVSEESIKITDYYGVAVDSSDYTVESRSSFTTIYTNKSNKVLFVDYIVDGVSKRELLDLMPIFTEATWNDLVAGEIPQYKYTIFDGQVDISYNGTLYIKYEHNSNILLPPVGELSDDSWYVEIKESRFKIKKNEQTYSYSMPEYYLQKKIQGNKEILATKQTCKVLYDDIVKLQKPPVISKDSQVVLYVIDYFSGDCKYVYTTDSTKVDSLDSEFTSLRYKSISGMNTEGTIRLPVKLSETDIVKATYKYSNDTYRLQLVDVKGFAEEADGIIAVYFIPDASDAEAATYFAIIGKFKDKDTSKRRQGICFATIEDYEEYVESQNTFHVGYVQLSNSQLDLISIYDARIEGGSIIDKTTASKETADIFYQDLLSGNITIPTNDALVAVLDVQRLVREGIMNPEVFTAPDKASLNLISYVNNTIMKNVDASTDIIMRMRGSSSIQTEGNAHIDLAGITRTGLSITMLGNITEDPEEPPVDPPVDDGWVDITRSVETDSTVAWDGSYDWPTSIWDGSKYVAQPYSGGYEAYISGGDLPYGTDPFWMNTVRPVKLRVTVEGAPVMLFVTTDGYWELNDPMNYLQPGVNEIDLNWAGIPSGEIFYTLDFQNGISGSRVQPPGAPFTITKIEYYVEPAPVGEWQWVDRTGPAYWIPGTNGTSTDRLAWGQPDWDGTKWPDLASGSAGEIVLAAIRTGDGSTGWARNGFRPQKIRITYTSQGVDKPSLYVTAFWGDIGSAFPYESGSELVLNGWGDVSDSSADLKYIDLFANSNNARFSITKIEFYEFVES